MSVSHLTLDLGTWHQCGHRVDDDDIEGAGADQHVGDLQRLLTCVWLRNQHLVDVDSECLGIDGVEGMLGIDKGGNTSISLCLGDYVQPHGGFARALRAVDLDYAPAGHTADSQSEIQG